MGVTVTYQKHKNGELCSNFVLETEQKVPKNLSTTFLRNFIKT